MRRLTTLAPSVRDPLLYLARTTSRPSWDAPEVSRDVSHPVRAVRLELRECGSGCSHSGIGTRAVRRYPARGDALGAKEVSARERHRGAPGVQRHRPVAPGTRVVRPRPVQGRKPHTPSPKRLNRTTPSPTLPLRQSLQRLDARLVRPRPRTSARLNGPPSHAQMNPAGPRVDSRHSRALVDEPRARSWISSSRRGWRCGGSSRAAKVARSWRDRLGSRLRACARRGSGIARGTFGRVRPPRALRRRPGERRCPRGFRSIASAHRSTEPTAMTSPSSRRASRRKTSGRRRTRPARARRPCAAGSRARWPAPGRRTTGAPSSVVTRLRGRRGGTVEGARRRRRVFERPRGFDPGAVRTIRDERLEATPRRARASPVPRRRDPRQHKTRALGPK